MNDQPQGNRQELVAGGPLTSSGAGAPSSARPRALVVVLACLVSLAILAAVLLVVAFVTGDRLRPGRSGAGPAEGRRPARSASAAAVARQAPGALGAAIPRDALHDRVARMLAYLSAADLGGAKAGQEPSEEEENPELAEQLRLAAEMFPIGSAGQDVDVPEDLELPENARIIAALPYGEPGRAGAHGGLLMARLPGSRAAARDFFVNQAKLRGWACTERPAATEGALTLLIEKGDAGRMITLRELASGAECLAAICDLGPD